MCDDDWKMFDNYFGWLKFISCQKWTVLSKNTSESIRKSKKIDLLYI